jgi:hypothetical protein
LGVKGNQVRQGARLYRRSRIGKIGIEIGLELNR